MKPPTCSGIRCYRFGPYLLDAHKSQLRRGDTPVPLAQKTVEVLTALIEHPGISKADLMRTVWPGTVVEENNLARHISMLRRALQERPDQHEYILTIAGHGYRFVADVERVGKAPPQSAANPVPASEANQAPPPLLPVFEGSRQRTLATAVILSGLLVTIAVVAVWLPMGGTLGDDSSVPTTAIRPLTYGRGLEQQPTWSPDGRSVAYASDAAGSSDIWVVAVDDPNPTRVTESDAHESQPAWSPDGRWIAFRSEQEGGGLFVVPANGGPARRIAPFGFRPSWSPSGPMVLFSGPGPNPTLYLVGLDGAPPRPLEHDAWRELSGKRATWSPDGEQVSVLGRVRDGHWRLVTVPVGGGPAVTSPIAPDVLSRFQAEPIDIGRIVWSASADFLYFSGRSRNVVNLWRVSTDPGTLAWTKGPERLTSGTGDDQDPAVSADGTRVAFTAARTLTRIWSVPFDSATGRLTGAPEPLTPGEPGEYDAAVPPDGTRLVYRTVRGSRQEVWERSLGDGSHRLLLASREWAPTSPRWSRDGTRLAFTRRGQSLGTGDGTVVILSPTTGLEDAISTPGFVDVVPDDWTADGQWILASCRSRAGAYRETCLMPTSNHRRVEMKVLASDARRDLIFQRFSPDGRWISFIAQDPADLRTSTLYTMPAAGGPWTSVTSGTSFENNSRWAPDGRTLYFVSNRGGLRNVWGRHFDPSTGTPTGEPFRVTHFDSPARQLAVNRDGNFEMSVAADRLFLPVTETAGDIWLLERLVP